MATHISTKQVIAHVKTAKGAMISGISLPLTINDTDLTIGSLVFPLDKFDIGGMNPTGMHLVDTHDKYYDITFLDADGKTLPHPIWETEAYDPTRIRNKQVTETESLVPMSIYIPKTSA